MNSNNKVAFNQKNWAEARAKYLREGRLSQEQAATLDWLLGFIAGPLERNRHRAAEELGYDYSTIYKVYHGRIEGGLDNFCLKADVLRKRMEERHAGLIRTPVTDQIMEALDYARDTNSMVVIRGETGRGKTFVARHWAHQNNHGRTIYVRCPSSCSRAKLVRAVASAAAFGVNRATREIEDTLTSYMDRTKTLILDEAGHLVPTNGRRATEILDFVRDLYDICHAGIVMIFTDVYWEEITSGRLAPFFEQFIGRSASGFNLRIPRETIFADEVRAIVEAYQPEPTPDMIQIAARIAKSKGKLRTLFADLTNAARRAKQTGQPLDARMLRLAATWRDSGGIWDAPTV